MIISGKEISTKIKDQLKEEVEQLKNKYDRLPKLAVILVGENQASQVYVRNKERGCSYVGMDSLKITHDATFSEEELLNEIVQYFKIYIFLSHFYAFIKCCNIL